MKKLFFLISSLIGAGSATVDAQVVINEFMQSNIDCIMDDLNEFPDSWVELYNAGSSAVELSDYSIGITKNAEEAWKLPKKSLASKDYVLVYCDKEATKWHTPFRLESGKDCAIYLFKGTEIVDNIPSGLKKQPAPNIAYGRKYDGSEDWGYQSVPTPKATNCGTVYDVKKILGNPVFSIPGRVTTASGSTTVELSLPKDAPEGTIIRYTDDYTEPTSTSKQYNGPITFNGTKIIRAKLFCDGYLSPRSVTQSYISFPRKMTLPVISITTNKEYFFDSKIGIYSGSRSTVNGKSQENYKFNWRRPINFEYFEEDGTESALNQLCEARVTGGASRDAQLKSLGLYANKRFGEKRFAYEFFPDQRPGSNNFKSIMIRNAGNDFDYLYMRDAVIQRIMSSNVDIDWQAWRPAIFYLNGEYKGMLNIRERSNEENIYSNYNELEDIDMIENWGELKEGTIDNWKQFQDFYAEHDHTWAEYDELLDVQEFMNVMIMNLFFCNLDFPGNNIVLWRPRAEGGRWRIVVKDTDFGLGLYGRSDNYNTIEWLHNPNYDSGNAWANQYDHTRLFRRLMEDPTFNREFIDRCAIYMGDFMNFDRTWEIWEPMYEMIKTEYPNHRKLFNPWWPNYGDELRNAQNWLKNRPGKFINHVSNYYQAGNPTALQINKEMSADELSQITVLFNGVQLSRSCFDGKFYAGREVTLTGENICGWQMTQVSQKGEVTSTEVEGSTLSFTMPSCNKLTITAKIGESAGIEQVTSSDNTIVEIYDASGLRLDHLKKGYNIIRTKDGATKKVWY